MESSDSEGNIEEFIGLPEGFSFNAPLEDADLESEDDLAQNPHENAKHPPDRPHGPHSSSPITSTSKPEPESLPPSAARPLYSLHLVELLALKSDREGLDRLEASLILESTDVRVRARVSNGTVLLQREVLRLAQYIASGDYFSVLESSLVAPLIAGVEEHIEMSHLQRFMHRRVVDFIMNGSDASLTCGDPHFREPNVMTPDSHVSQRALRALACTFLGAACLGLFLQANWTGPPLSPDHTARLYPLPFAKSASASGGNDKNLKQHLAELEAAALATTAISGKPATAADLDPFPDLHLGCARMLEANGEPIYTDARFVHYLHTSRVVLRCVTRPTLVPGCVEPDWALPPLQGQQQQAKPPPENVPGGFRLAVTALVSSDWWCARSATCHQETLELRGAHSPCLLIEVEQSMDKTLRRLERLSVGTETDTDTETTMLFLEKGIFMHKFHEVAKAKQAFQEARSRAGLSVTLSGALGKRTKFQESKSQLVLLASSDSTTLPNNNNKPEGELAVNGELDVTAANGEVGEAQAEAETVLKQVKIVRLEDVDVDTPLREEIAFDEDDGVAMVGLLSSMEQCIILALCVDVKNSYAMEGLTAEEMLAYVARVQQRPGNWMVYSTSLLIKSMLEYERMKTKERAVLQMQLLVDQQTERLTPVQQTLQEIEDSAGVQERIAWLHALAWPPLWQLKRQLADRYLRLGVAASALKIFEEVRLWEEAVDCLQAMDNRARAEKLVAERLKARPTANLYCQMGILKQEPDYFAQAWEFSGRRYARAKRLWGIAMFELGDYEACIRHLQDAVDINPLFAHAWFRLGVAAMRTEQWRTAKHAFIQVTAQEPAQGDAWANLSAVYDKMGDAEAALRAVEQAAKHTQFSWKVWENYLTLSLKLKEWSMAIQAMERLIDLKVGLGARSNKEGDVDVQAMVLIVEGIITTDNVIGQARAKQTDTEENIAVRQRNCDFLRRRVESLFARIKAECKSDASVWKIMAAYFDAFDQREALRDALIRRVRALQVEGWERDHTKTKRVVRAVTELAKEYAADYRKDPSTLNHLRREVEMLLSTIKEKIATGIETLEGDTVESYCSGFEQLLNSMS